jgi:hypothetical protein
MILNPDIHDQLSKAHARDLLAAADHAATQPRQRLGARSLRFTSRRPGPRPDALLQRCSPSSTASR